MRETNSNISFSETSIKRVNNIINEMEGRSFHNHYHILYDICDLIPRDNLVYLEIGTYAGGSASLVSTNPKVTSIISVDIGVPVDKSIPIKNVNKFKNNRCVYEYVEGDSSDQNTINKIMSLVRSVDLLFIDGDHSFNGVISDFVNFSKLVCSGGYIVFDDYLDSEHSPNVRHAVDFIVSELNLNEYTIIGSVTYDAIKKTNLPHFTHSNEFILKKI